jgi:hypothetical protein
MAGLPQALVVLAVAVAGAGVERGEAVPDRAQVRAVRQRVHRQVVRQRELRQVVPLQDEQVVLPEGRLVLGGVEAGAVALLSICHSHGRSSKM